ncbi:hypothetical protein DVH05_006500 [Phytophthora capsici]|nr:hypothetical protein DVH05_006500 [Phytophthora capsici]
MDRLEVRALVRAPERAAPAAPVDRGITVDESLDEETFLKTLEETLQQHVASLSQQFLVLSESQVASLAFRLHDALVPKRDADTGVIQAWTIQPQLQLKVKASAHIQVLKLSTILREVQRLRLHQCHTDEEAVGDPIEVEIFPSLRVIEALNTGSRGLQNAHYFAAQLRELHIEHTQVTTLRELLKPEQQENKVWRKLLKLQMNCCDLQVVDASVNLLRAVRTLDLGWNQIKTFETDVTTKTLQVLNLCHNQLKLVPPIQSLRGLRELDLAVNGIVSLKGLEKLTALERLDISHNLIDDIAEVELLTGLPKLTYLKMEFNPIARRPDYRREVLFYLGEPIELDGQRWNDAEVSSMAYRRMLMMLDGEKERNGESSMWGQTVGAPAYPKARVRSGIVVKNPKLVLDYPELPRSQDAPAHFVEIQNPPSALPISSKRLNSAGVSEAERGHSSMKSALNSHGAQGARPTFRTVDEYFRTQRDVIVSKAKKERGQNEDQTATSGEDSDESNAEKTRKRSRKYTASDFMRDFEEEELLVREGNDIDTVGVPAGRSTSETQLSSPQKPGRNVNVRVLLSAKEAAELDLHFGIDGVPANVEIKSRELVERFTVSDGKGPIAITRWLPDVAAVGVSMHSSRAKIIMMKFRSRGSTSVADAAYQFDAVVALETLFSWLVARLYQQFKGHVVICNCVDCGALSLLTSKYPARSEAEDALMVYSCLFCSSCNVREIPFKKLVAICVNEGVTIPSSIPLAPPPWEMITEGFYIEEPAGTDPGMSDCVMVSYNGIREVAVPPADVGASDEAHSNEISDAIVHAMTSTIR